MYIQYNDTIIVKSLTMDEIMPEHKFISRGNPRLTSWFRRVELGPTQILRTIIPKNRYLSFILYFFCRKFKRHVVQDQNCNYKTQVIWI